MQTFTIRLDPQSQAFVQRLAEKSAGNPALLNPLIDEINLLNRETCGHIQEKKLSKRGPDTLGVVTAALRRSINATPAEVVSNGIESTIGSSNVAYAAVHEFGFDGMVTVKEHFRTLTHLPRKKPRSRKRERESISVVKVRSHDREMHVKERAYIRNSIGERLPKYAENIGRVAAETLMS